MTGVISSGPSTLHSRLHQLISRQKGALTASKNKKQTPTTTIYLYEDDCINEDHQMDTHYNERGHPYFKRRIMRVFSSFSTPGYRVQPYDFRRNQPRFREYGGNRFSRFVPLCHVTFTPAARQKSEKALEISYILFNKL